MSALRPVVLGLGMAILAGLGTDFLLQRRARTEPRPADADAPRATAPLPATPPAMPATEAATPRPVGAPRQDPAPAVQLAVGQRAVTLQLRDGVTDELLRPGVFVDVLATLDFQAPGGGRQTTTRVIAERVSVLAVHDRNGDRANRRSSVSLAVAAEAANAIELAAAKGTIGFALRAPEDAIVGRPAAASLLGLAGELPIIDKAPAAVSPPVATPKWEVQVIRGSASVRESVDAK